MSESRIVVRQATAGDAEAILRFSLEYASETGESHPELWLTLVHYNQEALNNSAKSAEEIAARFLSNIEPAGANASGGGLQRKSRELFSYYAKLVASNLHTRNQTHFVVERDGGAIGFTVFQLKAESAEIGPLFIRPEHRGRGAGTAAMLGVLEKARASGAAKAWTVFDTREGESYWKSLAVKLGTKCEIRRKYLLFGPKVGSYRLV